MRGVDGIFLQAWQSSNHFEMQKVTLTVLSSSIRGLYRGHKVENNAISEQISAFGSPVAQGLLGLVDIVMTSPTANSSMSPTLALAATSRLNISSTWSRGGRTVE